MFRSFPTWRVRAAVSDKRFARIAFSLAARSAQKARRVFQIAPRPSLCATAFWTMSPTIRSGWDKAMRKTHRAAVILHVKRVAREPERFGEMIHDVGEVIERIREFVQVWPVAVSEAWIIGRDKVIGIRKNFK